MEKLGFGLLGLALVSILYGGVSFAKEESQAVFSPKCNLKKFKKICGAPCKKVKKGSFEGGYVVTMDTDKLTWDKLIQKLVKEKCI